MTDLELRKLESIVEDIDTMCEMTMRKAKAIAEQYTLHKRGMPDKKFTDHTMDLIKIRLTMRLGEEIIGHDN